MNEMVCIAGLLFKEKMTRLAWKSSSKSILKKAGPETLETYENLWLAKLTHACTDVKEFWYEGFTQILKI